jgi:ribosomal protein S18 acetylase RimI-like enzyme
MTVQVRSYVDKDLSNLVMLINETNKAAYEFIPLKEEEVRARIQERKLRILMAEEDGGVLGSVTYNDGFWGEEIRWLAVCDRPNRKLIENMLIARIERCVHGNMVFTSVDAEGPKINDWIERGYKPEGGLYQMIANLTGTTPVPRVPEGTVIRSMKMEEEQELVGTVNEVFGWERLKLGFVQKTKSEFPLFSEEWVHVAELGGKIVSVVVSWPATKYNEFFRARRGYLGPAGTLPEQRGKKLASALTARAMDFLFEKGMETVALHTSERNIPSMTLLRSLGFEVGHQWRFMRKDLSKQGKTD